MQNNSLLKEYLKKGTLIAAHRGIGGGNLPFNTIDGFNAALIQKADIIETDVTNSVDGVPFIFHIGQEINHLNRDINLNKMTAEEIKKVRYVNADNNETFCPPPTLDEALECLKGRCLINLDHIWDGCFKETIECVRKHDMIDQVIIKTTPSDEYLELVEKFAPDFMYMAVLNYKDENSDKIFERNINFVGVELVFADDATPLVSPENIECYHKNGLFVWANAILFSSKVPLSGGHSDDVSVVGDFENGWGWLIDRKFDVIQTDWPMLLKEYITNR